MSEPTNTEIVTEARKVAKLYRGVGHRYGIEKNLDLLADRLEAAEAELTRRDTSSRLDRYALADALMHVYDHGTSPNALREADTIILSLAAAPVSLEAVKAETTAEWLPERVHWGVQAGDHPARLREYQTREVAEWFVTHPSPLDEGLEHVLVTRKSRTTEWRPVEAEGDDRG